MNAPTGTAAAPAPETRLAPVPRGRAGLSLAAATAAALAALAANKLRAALTALGIFIGVAAVVATVAVGAGARQQVLAQIQSLGANLLIVWASNLRMGGVSLGAGQRPIMVWDDAQAVQREIAGVEVAAGTIRQQHQIVHGNQNWAAFVTATDPEWFVAHDWALESGRFFTAEENMSGRKVVLLGQTVAQNLFGEEDPVGREVRIRATPFEVIGVLARKGQNPQGQDQDDTAVMPYWSARRSVMGGSQAFARHVQVISVKVREGEDMGLVEEEIRQLFRQRHRTPATDPDTVVIRNMSEIAATRDASARTLSLLLAAIAAVSLLVGGIGVMNIMLVSVTERTKEIGLRLAVGARRADILKQFLLEAVLLALLGGAAGVAGGFALAHGLAAAAGWPVLIQWDAVALAVGVAGLTGLFFGYWPARRAAHLDPIAALRAE
ncbi:MAG: ABC transporter permease [Rubritepida sp.]|nr:ABC transporter permease [Rubritepida sp.]MCU0946357.1 ABC transporter permease [Rubritepida sp.]